MPISILVLISVWVLKTYTYTKTNSIKKNNNATDQAAKIVKVRAKPKADTNKKPSSPEQLNKIEAPIKELKFDYAYKTLQEVLNDPYYKYSFSDLEALAKNDDFRAQQILAFRLSSHPPLNYKEPLKTALSWAKIGAYKSSYVSQALLTKIYALQNDDVTAHAFNKYFSELGNPLAKSQIENEKIHLTLEQQETSEKLLQSGKLQQELNKYQSIYSEDICGELGTCR